MKSLSIIKSALAAVLLLAMAACGQKVPSAEEVANRINSNEEVTEADFTSMIEYCGKYAKDAQKYYDIINAQPTDSTAEAIKATSELADLYADYPYLELFRGKLAQTEMSALGAANEKKVNEYAQYQAFPLPIGEGADLEDPNVVGMIEQMPASDTSGVISQGAGEAVDEGVK